MAPAIPSFGVTPRLHGAWWSRQVSIQCGTYSGFKWIHAGRWSLRHEQIWRGQIFWVKDLSWWVSLTTLKHSKIFKSFFFKKIIKFPRFDWAVTSIEVSSLKIEVACEFTVTGITFSNFTCPLPPTRPKHPYKLMGWWLNLLCGAKLSIPFYFIFLIKIKCFNFKMFWCVVSRVVLFIYIYIQIQDKLIINYGIQTQYQTNIISKFKIFINS